MALQTAITNQSDLALKIKPIGHPRSGSFPSPPPSFFTDKHPGQRLEGIGLKTPARGQGRPNVQLVWLPAQGPVNHLCMLGEWCILERANPSSSICGCWWSNLNLLCSILRLLLRGPTCLGIASYNLWYLKALIGKLLFVLVSCFLKKIYVLWRVWGQSQTKDITTKALVSHFPSQDFFSCA